MMQRSIDKAIIIYYKASLHTSLSVWKSTVPVGTRKLLSTPVKCVLGQSWEARNCDWGYLEYVRGYTFPEPPGRFGTRVHTCTYMHVYKYMHMQLLNFDVVFVSINSMCYRSLTCCLYCIA